VNVRKSRLRQLAEEGHRSAALVERLAEDSTQFLAAMQMGLTLTHSLAVAVAVLIISPPLASRLAQLPWFPSAQISFPVAIFLVVLILAIVMLVLGQLTPELMAMQHAERLALGLAPWIQAFITLAWPVAQAALAASKWVANLFGSYQASGMPLVTEEEIKTLVDAGEESGFIEEVEKEMIYGVFQLGETAAREVMVPRIDIVAVEANTPLLEALDVILSAGHSRIPVYEDTIDNIVGLLYAKDILRCLRDGKIEVPLRSLLRPVHFVPETKRVDELLPELQQRKVHMVIVVDEYGGTAGLVTIEDILEEIVGEIQDEYDSEEPLIKAVREGEYLADARLDLDDLNALMGTNLPTTETDTLGGFIYSRLGRVPRVGDEIRYGDLTITVLAVANRRIKQVRLTRLSSGSGETSSVEETGVEFGHGGVTGLLFPLL